MSREKPKREAPCAAVMLLLERMESHPEEFSLLADSRWGNLFNQVKRRVVNGDSNILIILEDFECEMLWSKFKAAGKKQLHAFVMRTILNPKGESVP